MSTGLDVRHVRDLIVRPVLEHLGSWSPGREALLIGTALQESGLYYLRQLGGGPALGLWQMEPATCRDIWLHFLAFRLPLWRDVRELLSAPNRQGDVPDAGELAWNLRYACAMAACHYLRFGDPVPDATNVERLAEVWKHRYNTALGAGTPEQFVRSFAPALGLYRREGVT